MKSIKGFVLIWIFSFGCQAPVQDCVGFNEPVKTSTVQMMSGELPDVVPPSILQENQQLDIIEEPVLTDDDFKEHVAKLKKRLPRGFKVVVQKPFVVIGNQSPKVVRRHAYGTVKRTVDLLKKDYFTKDPDSIIDIWLFGDAYSYKKYAKQLFGHTPDTPYGYFSSSQNALVMNISTGGGTLVHELVHPFVEANFPNCPPWLNEGLGSLYEFSENRNGHIWGLTNWRLDGLKRSIRRDEVPSFLYLTSRTEHQFYDEDPGSNYGQARFLCQYLQEKGLLVTFYQDFYKNRKADPTGYETLKKVLGEEEMEDFKKRWQKWVMKLVRKR